MGDCWAVNSWETDSWAANSWEDSGSPGGGGSSSGPVTIDDYTRIGPFARKGI